MMAATGLTAVIVDDEALALARMKRLLDEQGVTVVAQADNAAAALEAVDATKPDILFADIEMAGVSGMRLGAITRRLEKPPLVVFVTGYADHAVQAFEQEAFDYLLKPVSADRLASTLARVRQRTSARAGSPNRGEPEHSQLQTPIGVLPIREDFGVRFVPFGDILCATSGDKKVSVRTEDGDYRTSHSLSHLQSLLPADRFLRIHDSHIVNLHAIAELLYLGDHSYEVRLRNGLRLRVGRSRYPELVRRLGLNG